MLVSRVNTFTGARVGQCPRTVPFSASRRTLPVMSVIKSKALLVKELQKEQLKTDLPNLKIGDTVKVGLTVLESKGKSRVQTVDGVIIAMHGSGTDKTVTVRRIFQGVGIELAIMLHSPQLASISVVRGGKVRRAKLFYLRERLGKSARLKETDFGKKPVEAAPVQAAAQPVAA